MVAHGRIDVKPPDVPSSMRAARRWVCWRYERRDGRAAKVPYTPAGRRASATDARTWSGFAEVCRAAGRFDGVGFVLGGGWAGVDLDACRDPGTGRLEPRAASVVTRLDSYAEVSPSGTGVHVICRGKLPPGRRRGQGVELYDGGRFFCVTGERLAGAPEEVRERTEALAALHREVFGEVERAVAGPRVEGEALPDGAVLAVAMRARNAALVAALWAGGLAHYPTASEADAALAHVLAFYARDAAQLEALMRRSGRWRAKWESRRGRTTWIGRECARACARVAERYGGRYAGEGIALDRRLLGLEAGPLLVAVLLAAGVAEEGAQARALGVTVRTVRGWRRKLQAAGLEAVARKRPSRGYVVVPRRLLDCGLSVAVRATAVVLAGLMTAGRARVGIEALAARRGLCGRQVRRHLQALEAAGLLLVERGRYYAGAWRCNSYRWGVREMSPSTKYARCRVVKAVRWAVQEPTKPTTASYGGAVEGDDKARRMARAVNAAARGAVVTAQVCAWALQRCGGDGREALLRLLIGLAAQRGHAPPVVAEMCRRHGWRLVAYALLAPTCRGGRVGVLPAIAAIADREPSTARVPTARAHHKPQREGRSRW